METGKTQWEDPQGTSADVQHVRAVPGTCVPSVNKYDLQTAKAGQNQRAKEIDDPFGESDRQAALERQYKEEMEKRLAAEEEERKMQQEKEMKIKKAFEKRQAEQKRAELEEKKKADELKRKLLKEMDEEADYHPAVPAIINAMDKTCCQQTERVINSSISPDVRVQNSRRSNRINRAKGPDPANHRGPNPLLRFGPNRANYKGSNPALRSGPARNLAKGSRF